MMYGAVFSCLIVLATMVYPGYSFPKQMIQRQDSNFGNDVRSRTDELSVEDKVNKAVIKYHTTHNNIRVQWDCDVCKVVVGLIQELAEERKSWGDISTALHYLCVKLQVEDETVCSGIIPLYRDEVLTVLDHLLLKPVEVCSFTFGESCGAGYDPFKMWNITLPKTPKPPVKPVPPPKKGSPTLRILHLSDIHVDMQYKEGSEAQCGEPLCCRQMGPHVVEPAGKWGSHHVCDLPVRTLVNLFQHLASSPIKFDYIVWTGDLPAHYVWLSSKNDTEFLMKYLSQMFLKYFPNTPVYSTLGNHEGVPVNSFPPKWGVVPANDSSKWLYHTSAETWLNWLPPDTLDTILKGGFYTTLIYPGLRMISLNMNMCNNENWWLLLNMTDPVGQLQWLIQVLQRAEDNHEKVQIIGHIPPGVTTCVKAWSWNYYKIINRYESTIVGQFYGHVHHDEYEIFYDPASNFTRPTSIAYIGPSVEASSSGNNGYKVYTVDGNYSDTTWAVLDFDVHVFNLTEANLPGQEPKWYKEYSAKDAYNMSALQPADWDKLLKTMETNDDVFGRYYSFHTKSYVTTSCDVTCKQNLLCAIRSARSYDKQLCQNYTRVYTGYAEYIQSSLHNTQC